MIALWVISLHIFVLTWKEMQEKAVVISFDQLTPVHRIRAAQCSQQIFFFSFLIVCYAYIHVFLLKYSVFVSAIENICCKLIKSKVFLHIFLFFNTMHNDINNT